MNARQLIKALETFDPETPVKFGEGQDWTEADAALAMIGGDGRFVGLVAV